MTLKEYTLTNAIRKILVDMHFCHCIYFAFSNMGYHLSDVYCKFDTKYVYTLILLIIKHCIV